MTQQNKIKQGRRKQFILPEVGDRVSSEENLALVNVNVIVDPCRPCI